MEPGKKKTTPSTWFLALVAVVAVAWFVFSQAASQERTDQGKADCQISAAVNQGSDGTDC